MDRTDVVQAFLDPKADPTYLEIGVRSGHTFLRARAARKLAVDPAPRIGRFKRLRWRLKNRSNRNSRIYRMTSDEFFARHAAERLSAGLDVAFVDGLHTYEQSLRDVESCLRWLNPGGAVLMHDCSPPCEGAATPAASPQEAQRVAQGAWNGMWCGDVYKTVLHLRSQRPDLEVCVLDCDRGIGVVRSSPARGSLALAPAQIDRLGYADLVENRREWLDLRPPSELPSLVAGC